MAEKKINYDILNNSPWGGGNEITTHLVSTNPLQYDEFGVKTVSNSQDNIQPVSSVSLRENPSNSSTMLQSLSNNQEVIMLREWASGNNEWAYVLEPESNNEGYVLTQHLKPNVVYDNKILRKSKISLTTMTPLERAMVPEKSWMALEAPYYHTENGEWWFSVTLPYTCIEAGMLPQMRGEARIEAIEQMYKYFDINPFGTSTSPKYIPTVQNFNVGLQSSFPKDYYLGTRPGSEVMFLVIIPAIYVEYLKEATAKTEIGDINEDFCISIPANSLDDLTNVQKDITECMVRLYQSYLNSNVEVTNFNFENEIFKQTQGITQIKFLLKENDIFLGSAENQTTSADACTASPVHKKIQVCFDEQYMLKAVYYYNNKGEKTLLSNGLNVVKNSFPFNEERFGNLFLNHQALCSLPDLTLKTFFEEYVVDPKPDFKVVTYNTKTPKQMSPYAMKELGAYVDTALFLTSIAKEFGNIFDLNTAAGGNLGFGCYSSNKAVDAFKLKALEYRDSQFMFSGDIMAFFQWVCNLKFNDMEEAVEKAGNGKGDHGWEWLVGDAEIWNAIFSITFSDWRMPSFSLIGAIKGLTEKALKAAVDKITLEIVKFFLRVKCELLLAGITALGALAAGLSIASYYASQGKKNKLGEDVSALPSPSELTVRDYGGENFNNILQESFGSEEDYNNNLLEIFLRCGVFIPANQGSLAKEYLDGVSSMISPVELLALFSGSASNSLINEILKYTQKEFNIIYQSKNTSSKLANLFTCIGENTTQEAIEAAEQKIKEKANDYEFCLNLAENLEQIMKDKCPNPDVYKKVYDKEFGNKIETYQEIITLLEDECSSININLFNNEETGEKGILNVLNQGVKGQDKFLSNVSDAIIGNTEPILKSEAFFYYVNEEYQQKLQEITANFTDDDAITFAAKQGLNTGRIYQHNPTPNNLGLYYSLNPDGTEYISKSSTGESETILTSQEAHPLPSSVFNLIAENSGYEYSTINNPLNLSRHQLLFYSLVNQYFVENSKNWGQNGVPYDPPAPFGITTLGKDNEDRFFPTIFSSMIERYARVTGFQWGGDQQNSLQTYAAVISYNVGNIINYDQAKKEMQKHYDHADYDDPNDSNTVSPKQYAMMNAVLYAYVRLNILEYLITAMPFYDVFNFGNPDDALYELYPQLVKDYIKQKIITSLGEGGNSEYYVDFINNTYEYIRKKSSYQIKPYSGPERGLNYYLESNFKSVYEAFKSTLDQIPPEEKKDKSWIETGMFIYDRKKSLQPHSYAGLSKLVSGNGIKGVPKSALEDLSDTPYSLHGDNYKKFRNGMFFIQNYLYIKDKDLDSFSGSDNIFNLLYERPDRLKGVVNSQDIQDLYNILAYADPTNPSAGNNTTLSTLFANVKRGSRLCFGIAYDNIDPFITTPKNTQNLVKEIFDNYQKAMGEFGKSGKLTESNYEGAERFQPLEKAIVCLDGNGVYFSTKVDGVWTVSDDPTVGSNDAYVGTAGTTSIVIPIYSIEEDLPPSQMEDSFEDFHNKYGWYADTGQNGPRLSDLGPFQNLNEKLINDERYESLKKACFSYENMLHFNAIFGIDENNLGALDLGLTQTKQLFVTNIKNIVNTKNTS